MYGGYYGYGIDPTMILLIPAMILTMYAQFKVTSTTNKYFKVRASRGYTGAEVAQMILNANGIRGVRIEPIGGTLSDHYDPRSRVLTLSTDVYNGRSITSIAVAAHECGHAIQHANEYAPLTIRGAIVPAVNFASSASWVLIMLGLFMSSFNFLLQIGIILFAATVFFQLITLPVEFNASHRALIQLESLGIVDSQERRLSRKVLTAAALTYVAAAATALLQLIRLVLIARGRDD